MRKRFTPVRPFLLCGVFALLACPLWATEPCVDGYGGHGTPEQEEQWYREHVQWCLGRIMAYPKKKGFVGPMSKAEAVNRSKGNQKLADWWAGRDDEWLYNFLPAETPRQLCVGYSTGCPIHGGMRGTMRPDLTRQYYYQCAKGKEWWYPGCKAKNPATGEEVTVVDSGDGWPVPRGFPAAETSGKVSGRAYYFKQAWPAALLKKGCRSGCTYRAGFL